MSKLSGYTEATAGAAADFLYVVQGGASKKLAIGNIATTGTWTPVIQGSVTAGGPHTYTSQLGLYARIGSIVLLNFAVATSALGAAMAGTLQIGGLPFASANTSGNYAVNTVQANNLTMGAGYTWALLRLDAGLQAINFIICGPSENAANFGVSGWPAVGSCIGSLAYRV